MFEWKIATFEQKIANSCLLKKYLNELIENPLCLEQENLILKILKIIRATRMKIERVFVRCLKVRVFQEERV